MKRWMLAVASCLALALVAGCGDNKQNPTPDGKVKPDGGKTDGPGTLPDGTPLPDTKKKVDLPPTQPSALQAVLNTMTLPKSDKDYAYDFEGKGTKKNQLGAIVGVINTLNLQSFDFQTNIDGMISSGAFILLMDIQAKSITNDTATVLQAFQGQDNQTPPNPSKIYSGNANLKVIPGSPQDLILQGKIASSLMTVGPGNLVFPLPVGATPTTVQVQNVQITATLGSAPLSAMTGGQINGVIPWTEVDTKLIPAMAAETNATYNSGTTPANIKSLLKTLFDTNADGTITTDELRNNLLLKVVLAPDVDTNNDGKADAMSIGIAFTGVGCTITK